MKCTFYIYADTCFYIVFSYL